MAVVKQEKEKSDSPKTLSPKPGGTVTGSNEKVPDDDMEDDLLLDKGQTVESSRGKYNILDLLGEGGFGAVYRVSDVRDSTKIFAMKVEKAVEGRIHSKLKMEVYILKMNPGKERKKCHFTKIVDRGKKPDFTFIVMQLVGPSLAELRSERVEKCFTIATTMGAGVQCLEACEDLHNLGFVHRDLKPANYAIGCKDKRLIYILDFGISRRILNSKGELKAPRIYIRFKGTVKYASISCHSGHELGPSDDCESWFYMIIDLLNGEGLPWKSLKEKNEVKSIKEKCRKNKDYLIPTHLKCKGELGRIFAYLSKQAYFDKMDYGYIYKLLKEAAVSAGSSIDSLFDWEK